jgi:hypothetical protein
MARLLRFAALSSLALLALSYLPSQASAVSVEHVGRNIVRAHDMVAKRKRADTTQQKRCPPKSTSTSAKPSATPKVSSNQSSGGDNPSDGGSAVGAAGKVGFGWGGDDQHLHYWKTGLTKTFVLPSRSTALSFLIKFQLGFTTGTLTARLQPRGLDSSIAPCSGDAGTRTISPPIPPGASGIAPLV